MIEMRKNLTIFIGILMILSFCDAQEETETAVDEQLGNEEVVAGEEIIQEEDEKLKGKSEYRKTKMFDPMKCTIDPPPTLKELETYYDWMDKNKRRWSNAKQRMCKMVRVINDMREIEEHNEKFRKGEETYSRELWDGSDLTLEEKREKYLLKNMKEFKWRSLPVPTAPFPPAQEAVNYTALGLVHTPVPHQGSCGSCYAFTAIAALEGQVRKCGISNEKLSEQSIVDCATIGVWGCSSGWPFWSYRWMMSTGIMTNASYPYTAVKGNCSYNSSNIIGYVDGAFNFNQNVNETFLRQAVSAIGPVGIVMCVENSFFSYKSGVYKPASCCTAIHHAMTIVGYGTDPVAGPFWIVKNSWGSGWGEQGFVRFARGTNLCIIESQFSYPSVRRLDGTLCS